MKAKELATPKSKVLILYNDLSIGEAIKIMNKRKYQMIPVVERNSNRYLYSVSSRDILVKILNEKDLNAVLEEPLSSVAIDRLIIPCQADTDIGDLLDLIVNQNYVPLVDANGVLQGIVTRRALINHLAVKGE